MSRRDEPPDRSLEHFPENIVSGTFPRRSHEAIDSTPPWFGATSNVPFHCCLTYTSWPLPRTMRFAADVRFSVSENDLVSWSWKIGFSVWCSFQRWMHGVSSCARKFLAIFWNLSFCVSRHFFEESTLSFLEQFPFRLKAPSLHV